MLQQDTKIVIVTPGFAKDESETYTVPYIQDYLKALAGVVGKDNIKIVTTQYPFTRKKYIWNGIEVFPSGGKNKRHIFLYLTLLRTIRTLKNLCATGNYVLHSFWLTDATFMAQQVAQKKNIRFIATIMGQDAKKNNKHLRFLKFDRIRIVAVSKKQERVFFESTGLHAEKIIPFAAPAVSAESLSKTRDIDILFVGSFIDLKHPDQFVEIVQAVQADYPHLKAMMIGEGDLFDETVKDIREKHLENIIELKGLADRKEVFSCMSRAKILVHTSEYEGQGLVFSEALAHGMYVMSYNVGNIQETPKHQVFTSPDEMKISLYKLLQQDLSYEPYQQVSAGEVVAQYMDLYTHK